MVTALSNNVVIVGEAPGKGDSGMTPLFGGSPRHAGWRLREMCGYSRSEWRDVRRVNLFAILPEQWSHVDARTTARAWMHSLLRGHRLILLGNRVARAFDMHRVDQLVWLPNNGNTKCAVIPHPSGRNLAYNDAALRARVGEFVRSSMARY